MFPSFPFTELHNWYKSHGRNNLPWRNYNYDKKTLGYRVWLAETMLQQTQVERVKDYFENIIKAFPTVEDLAACSYENFFPYYKGLGYYSRARNMLKAAQTVTNDFGGIFPQTSDELSKLAGVGPYTAEAIKAFAYDESTLSFDTNLEKIFSRYYFGNKFRKLSKEEKAELLNQMQNFCEKSPLAPLIKGGNGTKGSGGLSRDINNALMDYGATISLNSIPSINWDEYPLKSSKFYKTRGELEPVKEKKKSSFPSREAIVFAILHEDHKKYFSGKENFSPFFVGKNTGNPRAMIQEFFRQKFGLELSVRPPEIKSYKHETPYMVCYCQIQSGKHNFKRHEGLRVRGTEESLIESMPNI